MCVHRCEKSFTTYLFRMCVCTCQPLHTNHANDSNYEPWWDTLLRTGTMWRNMYTFTRIAFQIVRNQVHSSKPPVQVVASLVTSLCSVNVYDVKDPMTILEAGICDQSQCNQVVYMPWLVVECPRFANASYCVKSGNLTLMFKGRQKELPVRELNPGHPRDRRVYWPLY